MTEEIKVTYRTLGGGTSTAYVTAGLSDLIDRNQVDDVCPAQDKYTDLDIVVQWSRDTHEWIQVAE